MKCWAKNTFVCAPYDSCAALDTITIINSLVVTGNIFFLRNRLLIKNLSSMPFLLTQSTEIGKYVFLKRNTFS